MLCHKVHYLSSTLDIQLPHVSLANSPCLRSLPEFLSLSRSFSCPLLPSYWPFSSLLKQSEGVFHTVRSNIQQQRTQVWLPAHGLGGSQLPITPIPGHQVSSSSSGTYTVHIKSYNCKHFFSSGVERLR